MTYSEITMSIKERQEFIDANRDKFTNERLLAVTKRLNEDRAAQAVIKKITWHPSPR